MDQVRVGPKDGQEEGFDGDGQRIVGTGKGWDRAPIIVNYDPAQRAHHSANGLLRRSGLASGIPTELSVAIIFRIV